MGIVLGLVEARYLKVDGGCCSNGGMSGLGNSVVLACNKEGVNGSCCQGESYLRGTVRDGKRGNFKC